MRSNVLLVRVGGLAPQSRSEAAVLAGANAAAIETALGWELLQFRSATLIGGGVWRLAGLLRGQQGSAPSGSMDGAVVVFLDQAPQRAESSRAERGLPLIWRAGQAGGPAGGAAVSEVAFTISGLHERPWSPAHAKAIPLGDGGLELSWIARKRIDGDRWDGDGEDGGPPRFRVRVLDGSDEVRAFEIEGAAATYAAAAMAEDFPAGLSDDSRALVAQWGDGYGWGLEASIRLAG